MPGVIGTHRLKSDPALSKFFGSNTRGMFFGVGDAEEWGGLLDEDGLGDEPVVSDVGGSVAAPVSALVQPAARAHSVAPITTDQVTTRCPSMNRC
jgi:hypothetical protein